MNETYENISALHLKTALQSTHFHHKLQQLRTVQLADILNIQSRKLDDLRVIHSRNTTITGLYTNLIKTLLTLLLKERARCSKVHYNIESNFGNDDGFEAESLHQGQVVAMQDKYESKIKLLSENLQETIEVLETNFKEQLHERQNLVRELLKLLNDKNAEFTEYITTLNEDHERKVNKLKIEYEQQLHRERDEKSHQQIEINVLLKKLKNANQHSNDLERDKSHLLRDHEKRTGFIKQLEADIEELRLSIDNNDENISRKEKYINTLDKQNQELEKHKEVLNKKVDEIKLQHEPVVVELKMKNEEISHLRDELALLLKKQCDLQLQVDKLKMKVHGGECQLSDEVDKRKIAQAKNHNICQEIFELTAKLDNIQEMKKGITQLYHRYVFSIQENRLA